MSSKASFKSEFSGRIQQLTTEAHMALLQQGFLSAPADGARRDGREQCKHQRILEDVHLKIKEGVQQGSRRRADKGHGHESMVLVLCFEGKHQQPNQSIAPG